MIKAPHSEITNDEKVGRAIHKNSYDSEKKEFSYHIWDKKGNTSVSRLQVLSLQEIREIWIQMLHEPPVKDLAFILLFSKDDLQAAIHGNAEYRSVQFDLVPDPCCVQDHYKKFSKEECTNTCPYNTQQLHCPVASGISSHPCVRNYAHALVVTKISRGLANTLNRYLASKENIHSLSEG